MLGQTFVCPNFLFHPQEIHECGNLLFPVGFAVAAAHLALHLHGAAQGLQVICHPLVPAVGLAGAVGPVGPKG